MMAKKECGKHIAVNTFAQTQGSSDYSISEIRDTFGNIQELIKAHDDEESVPEEHENDESTVENKKKQTKTQPFRPHVTSRQCIDKLQFRTQESIGNVIYDQGYKVCQHNGKQVVTRSPLQVVLQEIRTKPSTDKVVYIYDSEGITPTFPEKWNDVFFLNSFRIRDDLDDATGTVFRGKNEENELICDTFICGKVSRRQ
jgi:hypothetical protein